MKGACPLVIGVSAASSKTVLVKFCPLPPTFENRGTCVPFGAIKTAVRLESRGAVIVETDRDVGDRERAVVSRNGQRRAQRPGAGASSPWESSGRRCCSGNTADR